MKKQTTIFLLVITIILVILVAAMFWKGNKKSATTSDSSTTSTSTTTPGTTSTDSSATTSPPAQTYACLYDTNASVETLSNYIFKIVVSSQKYEDLAWGELWKDNGTRSVKTSELQNSTNANKVYFTVKRSDNSAIDKNHTYTTQVCDAENNTVQSSFLESKTKNPISSDRGDGESTNSSQEIPGFYFPTKTGNYRIDGLVFDNGSWKLVDRINEFELK